MGRGGAAGLRPVAAPPAAGDIVRRPLAPADLHQRADHAPDHVAEKPLPSISTEPAVVLDRPRRHRVRASIVRGRSSWFMLRRAPERGEIVLARNRLRRLLHRLEVQRLDTCQAYRRMNGGTFGRSRSGTRRSSPSR